MSTKSSSWRSPSLRPWRSKSNKNNVPPRRRRPAARAAMQPPPLEEEQPVASPWVLGTLGETPLRTPNDASPRVIEQMVRQLVMGAALGAFKQRPKRRPAHLCILHMFTYICQPHRPILLPRPRRQCASFAWMSRAQCHARAWRYGPRLLLPRSGVLNIEHDLLTTRASSMLTTRASRAQCAETPHDVVIRLFS